MAIQLFSCLYIYWSQENLLKQLEAKKSKIEICRLKSLSPWFRPTNWWSMLEYFALITDMDSILPERVPDENFKDLVNLFRASYRMNGSDWEKALVSILVTATANEQISFFL